MCFPTKNLPRMLVLCLTWFSHPVIADSLTVAVASNFQPAARELADVWESQTAHNVRLVVGATGQHYAQIRQGAPFDAWLAADRVRPQALLDDGLGVEGSLFVYAQGRLALWSHDRERIDDGPGVLQDDQPGRLAIANPRLAPYGAAALETLESLGLDDAPLEFVQGQNVNQAFQFVASGNADLGLVAWSQVVVAGTGSSWLVPPGHHQPIEQAAVALSDAPAVRAWLDFLRSPAAHEVIRRYGYDVTDAP